jgi:hypothetical protein
MIKSKGVGVGEASSTHGKYEDAHKILVGKPEGKNHSEDLGVDGKTLLEWILGK